MNHSAVASAEIACAAFHTIDTAQLDTLDGQPLDDLPFGLIRLDDAHRIVAYNRFESELSGLTPAKVLGRSFFEEVAPCTNNFMVAEKFRNSEKLDEELDYVFTYRMKPTAVRLRLLKRRGGAFEYLLVRKRDDEHR